MKRISIYNNFLKNNSNKRDQLSTKLRNNGFITGGEGELLIAIGGDGTFLSAVRKRLDQNPIFVGINAGNLGFFSEFSIEDTQEFIKMLKRQDYWIQHVPVYEVRYKEKNEEHIEYFINDLVIERKTTRVLHMGVQVNNQNIGNISGDGLIISGPLGSTGYNMSVQGAISLGAEGFMQLTPVSPIYSSAYQSIPNSLLLNDQNEITIFPSVKKQRPFRVVCDGKELRIKNIRFLEIKKSEKTIRILRSKNFNPLKHIKHKILDTE